MLQLAADDIDTLHRLSHQRRHLQQLLKRTEGNAAWAGQVANITDGLDASSGGELLMQLAEGYRATGSLDLAADTYYLFARQYPDHPLVDAALMWLVQFYASGEAAHRAAIDQGTNSRRNPPVEVDAVGVSWAERKMGRGETGRGERDLPLSPLPLSHPAPHYQCHSRRRLVARRPATPCRAAGRVFADGSPTFVRGAAHTVCRSYGSTSAWLSQ